MSVTQLGYLSLKVSDCDSWRRLITEVVGAQERSDGGKPDDVFLRLDEYHHRIRLRRGSGDVVEAIGWEVETRGHLDDLASRIDSWGLSVEKGSRALAAERRVDSLIHFHDFDGFPHEIYYGPSVDDVPMRPSRAMAGFNCGDLGLGHIVLVSKDCQRAASFFIDALGFRISDYIAWDEADATFLHCNPRHHSLALMNECYGMKSGDLHHVMFEASSLDDVGRAYDLVQECNLPIVLTLGQHSNDRMTSFYMKTPSGFAIEYGWGGLLINDSGWQVRRYSTPKLWGHHLVD